MARIDQIAFAPGVEEWAGKTPNTDFVAHEDTLPDGGMQTVIAKAPAPQPVQGWSHGFIWKPLYWAYAAIGVLVLYVLFKK